MYEELVGALKKCGYPGDVHYCRDCFLSDSGRTCHMKKLLSAAADAIEELSKPRWIPVTEKLPGKDVPVLVYLFGDSPYIAWINHEGEWETEEFTIDRDYLPKAWMPLPEPPKEET